MKLLLLGATGGTGRQLLSQALDGGGHEVTVLVRSPEKLSAAEHLCVRTGDATDPEAAGEDYLRPTGLDWTLVYPPILTNGPRTGIYRSGEALSVTGVPKISRADIAEFMLGQLDDPAYIRRNVIVSP